MMHKKLLKKLLKLYFSDFRKGITTTLIIFIVVSIAFIFLGGMDILYSLLFLPIMIALFIFLAYGKKIVLYFQGLKDISKGNYETTYVTCVRVEEEKKKLFSRGMDGAITFFMMIGSEEELYRFCTVKKGINPQALNEFMQSRKWHIIYLKKSRIILNIQLNNNTIKDNKKQKFEEDVNKAAKEIFGTFGKKA